ncbi:MAG: C40 family peptidase [Elusimicrobia bacterium]|nr:C40 family peptidase [Elusimicrobiota bacterium]MDE2510453.1 C40 family peptidase [Elusimicrobiota bacterium]
MRAMTRHALKALPVLAVLAAMTACRTPPVRHPHPPATELGKALIRTARSYLPEEEKGRPTPKDCSDFVGRVFREHGVRLPRTSAAMSELGAPVSSSADLRMGDLLFFSGSKGGRKVGHVAIYVNNGVFIHQANPGEGVRMESLYSDYYRKRYLKARRVVN